MRTAFRLLAILVLVMVGGAITSQAAGAAKPPPTAQVDFVRGSGEGDFFGSFTVDVRTGPSGGTSATGSFSAQGGVTFNGPATCLAVTGNVAVFNVQTPQFGLVTVQVTDNAGAGIADVIDALPTSRAPTDCSPFGGGVREDVQTGDIAVFDAPPLPTSAAQCKHGGYARFGFRNQGQCIAFVHRGARG